MINYEQEVKKVYPNAEVDCYPIQKIGKSIFEWLCDFCIRGNETEKYDDISGMHRTEQSAWQSAYEKLKKEGKI